MASTYTTNLGLEKVATGEQTNVWGGTYRTTLELIEDAISGLTTINTTGGDTTLSDTDGAADQSRAAALLITGTLASAANIIVPAVDKLYDITNSTSGDFAVNIKTSGGSAKSIPQGYSLRARVDSSGAVTLISPAADADGDISTVRILRIATSSDETGYSTTSTTALAAEGPTITVTPSTSTSKLLVLAVTQAQTSRAGGSGVDTGLIAQFKYYDGAAYQGVGLVFEPILASGIDATGTHTARAVVTNFVRLTQSEIRSDSGNWTLTWHFSATYSGVTAALNDTFFCFVEYEDT